jgi:hypothetical protein
MKNLAVNLIFLTILMSFEYIFFNYSIKKYHILNDKKAICIIMKEIKIKLKEN